ncbi:hypothetical protein B0T19DRAFT_456074 [Cercophora scortea]|uniref:Uncharacterized protein n=1 Tax=Cercophora scortea TaxID=314031 RepID=A0AAE0IUV6_9PEZI|nr:hypothetical protein B0T19DRAFT_456074 [Cercophora scortea]
MAINDPANDVIFSDELVRDSSAEEAVQKFADEKLAHKGVDQAYIRCTPSSKGGQSWHKGGTDPNEAEHITANFYSQGQFVTTRHVYRK